MYDKQYYETRRQEIAKEDQEHLIDTYLEIERLVSRRFKKYQGIQQKLKELNDKEQESKKENKKK